MLPGIAIAAALGAAAAVLPIPALPAPHHHHAPPAAVAPGPADYAGQPAPRTRGRFIVHCAATLRDTIDPIVTPGMHGASHLHDFYGPTRLPRAPRLRDVLAAPAAACSTPADRSAYWVPVLYADGIPVAPQRLQAYYTVTDRTRPAPRGLALLAGDPGATVTDTTRVRWLCAGTGRDRALPAARACPAGQYLSAAVSFPGCWDGRHRDAPDHRAHLAYADAAGRCPRTHPVALPQLEVFLQWDCAVTCSASRVDYTLSSGNTAGLHADAVANWNRRAQARLIERCRARDCGLLGTEPAARPQVPASSG